MKSSRIVMGSALVTLLTVAALWHRVSVPTSRAPAPPVSAPFTAIPVASTRPGPSGPVVPRRSQLEGQPALAPPQLADLATDTRSPLADGLGAAGVAPEQEVRIVMNILKAYRRVFGSFPAGDGNRQIVNALRGANAQNLAFIPGDHPRLNARGELVDAWGTPFFFHQNSRTSVGVRSAGPDRQLFTGDDLVAGRPPGMP